MSPEETEKAILQGLQMCVIEQEIYYTTPEGLASRAAEKNVDLVVAAGGDGTIHANDCTHWSIKDLPGSILAK